MPPFVPPTILAAPPQSNGGGNFIQDSIFGGLFGGGGGSVLDFGIGLFEKKQADRDRRRAEREAAKAAALQEASDMAQTQLPPPRIAPQAPFSAAGTPGGVSLARGINPTLLLGGLGAAALLVTLAKR